MRAYESILSLWTIRVPLPVCFQQKSVLFSAILQNIKLSELHDNNRTQKTTLLRSQSLLLKNVTQDEASVDKMLST